MIKALLLSNSTLPGTPFFTWPRPWIQNFLGEKEKKLLFIPFAAVTLSFDEYADKVSEVFAELGHKIIPIHSIEDKHTALDVADCIVVGGGNTFALLNFIYQENLIDLIRTKVIGGVPYIGWSAGSNLACPTIMTTNDMPVVQPPSFEALNLVPFQINAHYHEMKFEGQGGETRKERLEEFLVMNPSKKVIGLPEGMLLHRVGSRLWVQGKGTAKLYQVGKEIEELAGGEEISFLLS